jgi:hypothetical protein
MATRKRGKPKQMDLPYLDTKLFMPELQHNATIGGRNLKRCYYVNITPEAAEVWRRYGFIVNWLT